MGKVDRGVLGQKAVFFRVRPRKKGVSVLKFLQGYYPFGLTFNEWTNTSPRNDYTYNGKEEQQEWDVIDYGARMYDAVLGRFFTQDRFAEKYMDNTPYHYVLNNPIKNIDINGDSTIYFGSDGNVLHVSDDGLENAVTFIGDDQVDEFKEQLFSDTMNDESSDLRGFGTSYMTGGLVDFFEENNSDTKNKTTGEENHNSETNEHGTYLYESNGEVRVGSQNITGSRMSIGWDNPTEGDPVGKVHTHPNEGEDTRTEGGRYGTHAVKPSGWDMETGGNKKGYYNVVVGSKNIYFYQKNRRGNYISIPRKNTFKTGKK